MAPPADRLALALVLGDPVYCLAAPAGGQVAGAAQGGIGIGGQGRPGGVLGLLRSAARQAGPRAVAPAVLCAVSPLAARILDPHATDVGHGLGGAAVELGPRRRGRLGIPEEKAPQADKDPHPGRTLDGGGVLAHFFLPPSQSAPFWRRPVPTRMKCIPSRPPRTSARRPRIAPRSPDKVS